MISMFIPSNDFMKKCVKSLVLYLKSERGIDVNESSFTLVKGNEEDYYKVSVKINNHNFEIFVYTDGAEFGVDNKNWIRCEYQDFDAEEELISYFIKKLDREIGKLEEDVFSLNRKNSKGILMIKRVHDFIWKFNKIAFFSISPIILILLIVNCTNIINGTKQLGLYIFLSMIFVLGFFAIIIGILLHIFIVIYKLTRR